MPGTPLRVKIVSGPTSNTNPCDLHTSMVFNALFVVVVVVVVVVAVAVVVVSIKKSQQNKKTCVTLLYQVICFMVKLNASIFHTNRQHWQNKQTREVGTAWSFRWLLL